MVIVKRLVKAAAQRIVKVAVQVLVTGCSSIGESYAFPNIWEDTKVLLKIFKSNLSNCILCFISSGLICAVLFLFEGMKVLILSTLNEYDRSKSSIGLAVQSYIFVLLFVGVILILYTISNYNRARIRDYAMFMVLGSEKKDIIRMIFGEYGIIYGISYIAGCIVGILLLPFIRYVFRGQGIAVRLSFYSFFEISGMVFFYMFFIFAVSVLINFINLQSQSISSLMGFKEKKSRTPAVKWSIIGVIAGVICLTAAIRFLTWPPVTYQKVQYGFFCFLCSLYLFFTYLGYLILMLLKKRDRWYERYLLKVKNLYYRFSENKNLMILIFTINFFVLVIVNINIVEYSNLSSRYLWKYPYDYVWMTEQKNVDLIETAVSDLKNKTAIYSYVTLSSDDGGEYTGISETSYKQLTGNEVSLKSGELISLIEKSESDADTIFQDDQIYLLENKKIKKFHLKYEKNEILFIAQQPELIGIVIMNDEDYTAMDSFQEKKKVLILQNITQDTLETGTVLSKTAHQCGALLYSKMGLMRQDRQQDITTLIFYVCLGVFLTLCSMTILAIKMWSEIPTLGAKYCFLKKIGMEDQEIKDNVKGELSICLQIPICLSAIAGMAVIMYGVRGMNEVVILEVLVLFVFLIIIQEIYIAGIRSYCYRLTDQWIYRGGRDHGFN